MTKLHKEIKEDIKTLSKLMEIHNLSELTVSYKELTYNLKRNLSNIRQIEHIVENNDLKEILINRKFFENGIK